MECIKDGGYCGLGGYCEDCPYIGYYSVTMDKQTWSKDRITIQWFEENGFVVKQSRLDGDKQVFKDGMPVATLFKSKKEASEYIGLN